MSKKPLRSEFNFGSIDGGTYTLIDHRNVPTGVPRSHTISECRATNLQALEKAKEGVIEHFRKYGFYTIGSTEPRNVGNIFTYVDLVVVPADVLRMRAPHLFGWTDREVLEMFEVAQQTDAVHEFPADELPRAKKLWSDYVRTGVKVQDAFRMEATVTEPVLPIEGNYIDALPNC